MKHTIKLCKNFENCWTHIHYDNSSSQLSTSGADVYAAWVQKLILKNRFVIIHWSCTWEAADTTIMRNWKWVFVNQCEFPRMVLTTVESSNLCQNRVCLSMCLKIMLKNKDTCWIKWTTFNFMGMSHKVFMKQGILKNLLYFTKED